MSKVANIFGWLGTIAVVVAVLLGGFPLLGVPPVLKPEWAQYSRYAAVTGLVLILLYIAGQWREIGASFERRQTRLGTIAASSVVLVLLIVVAVNYLASRRNYRWDLTANKQYSLSDQTRQLLVKLDQPVKAMVFAKRDEFGTYRDRLDEYEYASRGKLTTEYLDPDKEPVKATQNQVTAYGTVVFAYKGRTERVVGSEEQQLTNALIKVISGEQKVVYFLEGHGERDTTSSAREGYSVITQGLGSENYKVDTLALAQKNVVPANATLLVIAGPTTDLFQPEIDAIKQYLDRGGKLFVMVEPPLKKDASPLPNLMALLKEWGFDVGNNIIIDTNPVGQLIGTGELAPVATRYPSHPITSNFRVITAFPTARSVKAATGVPGRSPQPFIESSSVSWAETDLQAIYDQKPVQQDKDKDLAGPVPIAQALNITAPKAPEPGPKAGPDAPPKPETRVVVMGDSDFAANGYLGIQGNRDLFLNTVGWLVQQENLISIRPREADDRRITMSAAQQRWVVLGSIIGLPVLVFAVGILSWMRRRG